MTTQTDDALVANVQANYQHFADVITEMMDQLVEQFEAKGLPPNEAFSWANAMVLRNIFFRMTVMIAIQRTDYTDVMEWIEDIYDDWNEEAKESNTP